MVKLWAILLAVLGVMVIEAIEGTLSLTLALWGSVAVVVFAESIRRYLKGTKKKSIPHGPGPEDSIRFTERR
jgi:hypothetical protein